MPTRHLILAAIVAALAFPALAAADAPITPGWADAADIGASRTAAAAALLPSGKVLLTGGHGLLSPALASTQLYDPATNTWTATGSMKTARSGHAAATLANGKVLVMGGSGNLASAELYDPASGTWAETGSMLAGRDTPAATLLTNGKVFVAGGAGKATELYDPATGSWSAAAPMSVGRNRPAAVLLADGRVLVAGGDDGTNPIQSTEVYDPASNTWAPGTTNLLVARDKPTLTLLAGGKVLAAGGNGPGDAALASAELFDPATRVWSATGAMLAQHGTGTAATRLTDGRVLVTGGQLTDSGATASDVYDPAAGSWTSAGAPGGNRSLHTSTLLPSGQVLLAGSFGNSGLIASLFTAPTTLTGENLNLGNQTLGTTRPPTSVHITNTGTVPLLMRDVAVAGANAADFALVSDGCSGAPVAAGAACTLQIAFTPAAAGPRAAAVSFRANTPDTPHSFTLAGTGIATPTPTPDATPDATPVPVAAVPQPPAPATAPAAKPQLFATLAFTFKAGTRTTRLTSLTVQHVAKGATVAVKCPKGCAKKTFLKRNASGTVSLKTLVTKPLKVGTTLTVTVTKVGSSGLTKTLKIRSRRAPSVATKLGAL